jgi:2-polyprenyl-6-hydroxyphenyl methylase/3-demethylubiquinone-9 3-methyltransferase
MGTTRRARAVNNEVYRSLGERWYEADDDPIALLRAEARLHAPWIAERIRAELGGGARRVLDVGCGAGFIANALAARGLEVTGVDASPDALEVAARRDATGRARFVLGDARALPFPDASFDAACAMDFLEHVEPLDAVIGEIARVLAPGGLVFFHTFDRSPISWLVVIKAVELFVANVPRDLHVLRAFVKPRELRAACAAHGLAVRDLRGCAPRASGALLRLAATGIVPPDLEFRFTRGTWAGYSGFAQKMGSAGGGGAAAPDP